MSDDKKRPLTAEERAECDALKAIWEQKKRSDKAITQGAMADLLGISQPAVGHYLNGRNRLNLDVAREFADFLGVLIGDFSPRLAQEDRLQRGRIISSYGVTGVAEPVPVYGANGRIPVISYVQAGEFCDAEDPFPPGFADEYLPFRPPNAGPRAYALRVEGDSNHPKIRHGEYVIVDPDRAPDSGKFVVAKRHSDEKVTLKQIQYNEGEPFLKPGNPDWPEPIIKIDGGWSICGVVIGKYDPM